MTRQGRHSAPSSLHTAEQARSGPRCGVSGHVPAVGFAQGSGAPHQWTETILKTHGSETFLQHSAIAICIAHVLNSSRAPIASLTSKLTRHERGPNRGPIGRRVCTETRCSSSGGHQRASAAGVCRHGQSRWQIFSAAWCIAGRASFAPRGPRPQRGAALASGRCNAHRAELCGLAPSRRAPLS
jgi:hypothetical protein